jgi:hypothetical protein
LAESLKGKPSHQDAFGQTEEMELKIKPKMAGEWCLRKNLFILARCSKKAQSFFKRRVGQSWGRRQKNMLRRTVMAIMDRRRMII